MDQVINGVGSLWLSQKAGKELNTVGDDINNLQNSVEEGTKWLVNKIKGKVQKPITEILKEYDLPAGLIPRDATNYEFNEQTKKLTVRIPTVCEVSYKDQSILRFDKVVTGTLEKGKLSEVEGIKTKVMFLWLKVSCISLQESKLNFNVGLNMSRDKDAYRSQRDGVIVENF